MSFVVQVQTVASPRRYPGADNDDCPGADSDVALLARAAQGEAEAFAQLVRRHRPALYRVACRLLGQRAEAEDIVQECFARLWIRIPGWQSHGAGLGGWLQRVTINLCLDRLRRPAMQPYDLAPDPVDPAAGPYEVFGEAQGARLVETVLASLPPRHRAALVLSYCEDLPNAVVAEIMDLKLKAFESLLLRSRRRMRTALERRGLAFADFQTGA